MSAANMKHLESILAFATEKHKGQKRKDGKDYITHPIAVAEIAVKMARQENLSEKEIEMIYVISLFHDLKESVEITDSQFYTFLWGKGFDDFEVFQIVQAVDHLSRMSKEENVISYLSAIKADKYARIVKLADLEHNLSDLGPGNLRDKYHLCKYFLTN